MKRGFTCTPAKLLINPPYLLQDARSGLIYVMISEHDYDAACIHNAQPVRGMGLLSDEDGDHERNPWHLTP
jgi:hypothetical protein